MWRSPFVVITACLVTGILLGTYVLSFSISLIFCLTATAGFIGLALMKKAHNCVQLLLISALVAAASLRFHISQNYLPANHIAFAEITTVKSVIGKILEVHYLPEDGSRMIVSVSQIRENSHSREATGRIIVSTRSISQKPENGIIVELFGILEHVPRKRNPGQFDYRTYLARQDIYHRMTIRADSQIVLQNATYSYSPGRLFIEPLRSYCYNTFLKHLKEPAQSLAYALFLGEKQGLDIDTITQFKRTGVVHILAISGLHVGFIIVFILAVSSLLRLPDPYRFIVLVSILLIYVLLINLRPPVIRASLMAVFFLSAQHMQRIVNVHNLILAAAAIILLLEPRELFNPGFQFSFVAVLSITNGYNALNRLFPLTDWLKKRQHAHRVFRYFVKLIWMPFLVSCSATIGTLPLTWYYYGFIPLYAVFANLFVIPLAGALVLLTIFLLIFAPISSYISFGIAGVFLIIYRVLLNVVSIFSHLPLVAVECTIPSPVFILGILVLLFLFFHINYRTTRFIFWPVLSILVVSEILPDPPHDQLRVAFLDVGQGDAAVLQFPNRNVMLIDAGGKYKYWDNGIQTIIPYLQNQKIRHLRYVVLSHPHNDHLGGMISVLNQITVDTVVTTSYDYRSKAYKAFIKYCALKKIAVRFIENGDQLFADSDCRIYVLHPESRFTCSTDQDGSTCNNSSIVLKIVYGKNGLLFTGDAEIKAENSIINYGSLLQSDILKIAHHGSITSSSVAYLNEIQPLCAIISVASKNRFNHPSQITLGRIALRTPRVYQTKENGAVIFEITPEIIKKVAR